MSRRATSYGLQAPKAQSTIRKGFGHLLLLPSPHTDPPCRVGRSAAAAAMSASLHRPALASLLQIEAGGCGVLGVFAPGPRLPCRGYHPCRSSSILGSASLTPRRRHISPPGLRIRDVLVTICPFLYCTFKFAMRNVVDKFQFRKRK